MSVCTCVCIFQDNLAEMTFKCQLKLVGSDRFGHPRLRFGHILRHCARYKSTYYYYDYSLTDYIQIRRWMSIQSLKMTPFICKGPGSSVWDLCKGPAVSVW